MAVTSSSAPAVLHAQLSAELRLSWSTAQLLAAGQSAFQHWAVWQTQDFGRLYTLDASCMASEADEFLCHEPLVHIAGLALTEPQRALVLGGGDGASARELLRYAKLGEIVVAELDAAVVELTQRFIPQLAAGAFNDPRVRLEFGDALAYVSNSHPEQARYDLIVFDLTEPVGAAAPLFEHRFFLACKRLLSAQGCLAVQLGSPFFQRSQCRRIFSALCQTYRNVRPFFTVIPSYGGLWAMAVASDDIDASRLETDVLEARLAELGQLKCLDASQYRVLQACPPWLGEVFRHA